MDKLLPLLHRLQLFDADWYLANNEDVRDSGMTPWQHFQHFGLREGRQPGLKFSPSAYLDANPDVRSAGVQPLVHYLSAGFEEGRPLTPVEKKHRTLTGSCWPESPLPNKLPEWYGRIPGKAPDGNFRVLYVLALQSGGTPQTNEDLMLSLSEMTNVSVECFVLRCDRLHMVLYLFVEGIYIPLQRHTLETELSPFPHRSEEYDSIAKAWLRDYGIQLVHVRHSAWQGLGLIEAADKHNLPVVYSFHDYYTVCPSVKLLDDRQQFCGGRCSLSRGECHQELWRNNQVYPLKHEYVYAWQRQFAGPLALCSALVTTANSVREHVLDVFPALYSTPFRVIPHGRDFPVLSQLAQCPKEGEALRVLLPGHLALSKGVEILFSLATMAELVHVEWHVLGTMPAEWQARMPSAVKVHGQYRRDEFHQHVATIRPHVGAVLSIWPETWCHTLTELWSVGVPVLGFDIGAIGDRIKETGAGWLADCVEAGAIRDKLLAIGVPEVWRAALEGVMRWQQVGQRSNAAMAQEYWQLYRELAPSARLPIREQFESSCTVI